MNRFLLFCLLLVAICWACKPTPDPAIDQLAAQRVTLPNGWSLTPAGQQLEIGDLPLNMVFSPDQKVLALTHNGVNDHFIQTIDPVSFEVMDSVHVPAAWVGLAFTENGEQLFAAGGYAHKIWQFDHQDGQLSLADSLVLGEAWPADSNLVCGLAVHDSLLFALVREDTLASHLKVFNWESKTLLNEVRFPRKSYNCLADPARKQVYISVWGGDQIACYDWVKGEIVGNFPTGSHPNDMCLSPDGNRLFVACANDNSVTVIDLEAQSVQETLITSLYPDAPAGSTPNSVAIAGDYLFVANADNNSLAVFEIEEPGKTKSLGFIPTGWYPSAVRTFNDTIFVANGKGAQSAANPEGPVPGVRRTKETQYIGTLLQGTLSKLTMPTSQQIKQLNQLVYDNCPYESSTQAAKERPADHPIPVDEKGTSPIKYVFYVIKENRTYDQIFGDMPEGNGDASLCLFPDSVTPNQHALAKEFGLLDNFYVDAEVSADGHNWSMGAYANDYVEKSWPTSYGRKGGMYDYEGRREIAYPDAGFLWDACERAGVSFRSYGEFVWRGETQYEPLKGKFDPHFPSYNTGIMDTLRFNRWRMDFDSLLAIGQVPSFNVVRFGNDHTTGARAGYPTPAAQVADNDLAVGLLVDYLSHSPIWKETAIFVLEDDAQNGSDHVDAHRSIALVVSPYSRTKQVNHTSYTTCSMIRTMELILGLEPLSQYDQSALPMWDCFTATPDLTPYQVVSNQIALDQLNPDKTALARISATFDLSREDAAPDLALNEVIWKAVRGEASEMPAPRRSSFVRVVADDDEEEEGEIGDR